MRLLFRYKVKFEYTPGPSDDLQVPFKFKVQTLNPPPNNQHTALDAACCPQTYAPNVFRHIRERFGIDDDEYQVRLLFEGATVVLPVPLTKHQTLCCVALPMLCSAPSLAPTT